MRKLLALAVLFCCAASADAAEKLDHLLVVMLKSKDGQTKYGEQLVQRKTCDFVGAGLAAAKAGLLPVSRTPS
jgi:hypothetical protein